MDDLLGAIVHERALLGLCLVHGGELLPALAGRLKPSHFGHVLHRRLWAAILAVHQGAGPVEPMTVAGALASADLAAIGGLAGLSGLYDGSVSPEAQGELLRVLDDRAARRRAYGLGEQIRRAAVDPDQPAGLLAARARAALDALEAANGGGTVASSLGDVCGRVAAGLWAPPDGKATITSGFPAVDAWLAIGGLGRGNFSVVGGRTGLGKTNFSLITAYKNARDGKKVAIRSLEMTSQELIQRILSQVCSIDFTKILRPWMLEDGERRSLSMTLEEIESMALTINDSGSGNHYEEVVAWARSEKEGGGLDILIVDHLQLVYGPEKDRRHQVGNAANALKQAAKDLDCHAMALSQLPRPNQLRSDMRPRLWELKESGEIENASDLVTFVHRDGYYDRMADPSTAELILAKQRNGPTPVVNLTWEGQYVRFR